MNYQEQNQSFEQSAISPELDHYIGNILAVRDAIFRENSLIAPEVLDRRLETVLMLRIYSSSIKDQFIARIFRYRVT